MSLTAGPADYTVAEFATFSTLVTLTDVVAASPGAPAQSDGETGGEASPTEVALPVKIKTATMLTTGAGSASGVTITHTDTTFTIAGAFDLTANRVLHFIDANDAQSVVTSFVKLPSTYRSIFRYEPVATATTDIPITITLENHPTFVFHVTVTSDRKSDINKLKTLLSRGII